MRARRIIQLEVMKFYQREENRERRRKQQKENKRRGIFARLVGLK
jgi:hypothetical protein